MAQDERQSALLDLLRRAGLATWISLLCGGAAFAQASLDPSIGYQCPDGTQWNVNSCYSTSDDANCGVYRLDQPVPPIGFRVPDTMRRGDLVKRLSGCKPHSVTVVRGDVRMGAPIAVAPAQPTASSGQRVSRAAPAPARTQSRQSGWGAVTYANYDPDVITHIGNLPVVTKSTGSGAYITQIGDLPVKTTQIGNEWVMVRIGSLNVDYVVDGPNGQPRYTRIGDMPVESAWSPSSKPQGRWRMTYVGAR